VNSLKEKISALHSVRRHPDFDAVAGAYKRASNILRQAKQKGIGYSRDLFNDSLLVDPAEKRLHFVMVDLGEKNRSLMEQKQYQEVLKKWVAVRGDLDRFFEKVLVMDENREVRANRLSLLSILESDFKQLADFSLIQIRA
jgi:glycyl-tRNA synthetase beta chain